MPTTVAATTFDLFVIALAILKAQYLPHYRITKNEF